MDRKWIRDDMDMGDDTLGESGDAMRNRGANGRRLQADTYEALPDEAKREFFPGSGLSALTTNVKLMHCKILNHWTNKSFDTLLEVLCELCPKPNNIPLSYYEAKKMRNNVMKLMHCKILNHWTNKSFDTLLEMLCELSPKPNNIPLSYYEAKKMRNNAANHVMETSYVDEEEYNEDDDDSDQD